MHIFSEIKRRVNVLRFNINENINILKRQDDDDIFVYNSNHVSIYLSAHYNSIHSVRKKIKLLCDGYVRQAIQKHINFNYTCTDLAGLISHYVGCFAYDADIHFKQKHCQNPVLSKIALKNECQVIFTIRNNNCKHEAESCNADIYNVCFGVLGIRTLMLKNKYKMKKFFFKVDKIFKNIDMSDIADDLRKTGNSDDVIKNKYINVNNRVLLSDELVFIEDKFSYTNGFPRNGTGSFNLMNPNDWEMHGFRCKHELLFTPVDKFFHSKKNAKYDLKEQKTCTGYSLNTQKDCYFNLYKDMDWNLWYQGCTMKNNYDDLKQQYLWSYNYTKKNNTSCNTNKNSDDESYNINNYNQKFQSDIRMVFKKNKNNKLTLTFWKDKTLIGKSICETPDKFFNQGVFYLNEKFTYFPMFSSVGCVCCKNGITISVAYYKPTVDVRYN